MEPPVPVEERLFRDDLRVGAKGPEVMVLRLILQAALNVRVENGIEFDDRLIVHLRDLQHHLGMPPGRWDESLTQRLRDHFLDVFVLNLDRIPCAPLAEPGDYVETPQDGFVFPVQLLWSDRGPAVFLLQVVLSVLLKSTLPLTGSFDEEFGEAVCEMQRRLGYADDDINGIVDERFYELLNERHNVFLDDIRTEWLQRA